MTEPQVRGTDPRPPVDDLTVNSRTYERRAHCAECSFEIDSRTVDRVPTVAKQHVSDTGHPVTIRTVEVNTWSRIR